MSARFDQLMYEAGLTAQGSFEEMDKYDQEAIMRFGELIVKDCIDTLNRRYQWDGDVHDLQEIKKCIERIQTRFGVK